MAIYGVGIDLVRIERILQVVNRWGDRFLERVFTDSEREACSGKHTPVACFAIRFAAKEAFVKALGLGIRSPVQWRDVEVQNDERGKPFVVLSRRAMDYCSRMEIRAWHLSLTDDGEYGAAVVVLEC